MPAKHTDIQMERTNKEIDFYLIQGRVPNRTIKIQNGMFGDLIVVPILEYVTDGNQTSVRWEVGQGDL